MALISYLRRTPSNDLDWVQEYVRTASVEWDNERATIRNVRNFTYRSRDDYTPAWYDSTYNVGELQSVDLIVSRWAGESIAHVFVSFGFCTGQYLSISIETRRKGGQKYSKFGGFFRNYCLVYVVADERDLIGVRTDIRRERVCVYRADVPADTARALFRDYMRRINELNSRPEFYHTLFNNCTTNILHHARAVSPAIGYSWKLLLSGYADQYAYELGLLDQTVSFEELRERSRIWRNVDAIIDTDFSAAIRNRNDAPARPPRRDI